MVEEDDGGSVFGGITLIFMGLALFLAGFFFLIMQITMGLMGGQVDDAFIIIPLGFVFAGLVAFMWPNRYRMRYLVASALLFFMSGYLMFIHDNTIPEMKELAADIEADRKIDENATDLSGGLDPTSVDFAYYEDLVLALAICFILMAILLIVAFLIPPKAPGKRMMAVKDELVTAESTEGMEKNEVVKVEGKEDLEKDRGEVPVDEEVVAEDREEADEEEAGEGDGKQAAGDEGGKKATVKEGAVKGDGRSKAGTGKVRVKKKRKPGKGGAGETSREG
jgi:hypothetical protein